MVSVKNYGIGMERLGSYFADQNIHGDGGGLFSPPTCKNDTNVDDYLSHRLIQSPAGYWWARAIDK